MPGVIENMPPEAKLARLESLAQVLLDLVREHGSLPLSDVLALAAAQLRTAVSQIKQGLNFALGQQMLSLGADDTLTAVA